MTVRKALGLRALEESWARAGAKNAGMAAFGDKLFAGLRGAVVSFPNGMRRTVAHHAHERTNGVKNEGGSLKRRLERYSSFAHKGSRRQLTWLAEVPICLRMKHVRFHGQLMMLHETDNLVHRIPCML